MGTPMGPIIALQMANEQSAKFLIQAGNAALCDFDTIHEAGKRLRDVFKKDFPDNALDGMPVKPGEEDYVIRAVMEAIFGQNPIT
jgi:hypothetical protein